jgi:hypothetical protein
MQVLINVFRDKMKDIKLEETKQEASFARAEADIAKGMFNDTGNTSLPGLFASVMILSNKMYRLVKIKRDEWKTSVPTRDLQEVADKVKEYNGKINEIDINDRVMTGHKDIYKLTIKRLKQLNDEFTILIKSSAFGFSGGSLHKKEMFIGENEEVDVMSFYR